MNSTVENLRAYGINRLLLPRIGLLLIVLSLAGVLASDSISGSSALSGALFLLFSVIQLRIWDDCADRSFDRLHHPERVLPKLTDIRPFVGLIFLFGVSAASILLKERAFFQFLIFVFLQVGLACLYGFLRDEKGHRKLRSTLVLLKYPILILAVAETEFYLNALLISGVVTFLLVCFDFLPEYLTLQSTRAEELPPKPEDFEYVRCYVCGSEEYQPFLTAEDDLTGRPGTFSFVACARCGLRYQNPRLNLEAIKDYYGDDYIAHRRRTNWGVLTPLFEAAMGKLDRSKLSIVRQYASLSARTNVLDVGCGAGTFLELLKTRFGAKCVGTDFKDLSQLPAFKKVEFRHGILSDLDLAPESYDLITMWHFLEHDYSPALSLQTARSILRKGGCLVIEVPRLDSLSYKLFRDRWPGLQAPQHTALYTEHSLHQLLRENGWKVVESLPYGAFPAYFYFFAGTAFRFLGGKGLDTKRAMVPYFLGQILFAPFFVFERKRNLAMLTVVAVPDENYRRSFSQAESSNHASLSKAM